MEITRMQNSRAISMAMAIAVLVASSSVTAHHGAAAYDLTMTTTFEATVTGFEWTNPHALIHVAARDERGALQSWTAETAGLTILVRAGWSKTVLKAGDIVTIAGHPARNGTKSMILERVVLSDGRVLGNLVPR
jgi:hypothetical protein